MKRKLQVLLSEENWAIVENTVKEANADFANGSINYSDVINEMVPNAKVDIKILQAKHTNIRKSLRTLASQKELDLDLAIKTLMELKAKGSKRLSKAASVAEEGA